MLGAYLQPPIAFYTNGILGSYPTALYLLYVHLGIYVNKLRVQRSPKVPNGFKYISSSKGKQL